MAEFQDAVPFKTLVAQASAVLLTHGIEVETAAVHGVVAHLVGAMAKRVGMDEEEAVHLVTPEVVADVIMTATAERESGAAPPHAVRPVRVDNRLVPVRVESLGHLVMATAQSGKYASLNGDGPAAAHLLDLGTEIGAALVKRYTEGVVEVPVGVLNEVADRVDAVADCIEMARWSVCPCGEDHGQKEADLGALPVMRHHAALARGLRDRAAE
ncbi:hypothetical protein ACWD6I_12615 [Streptomyces sp. NPDC002454]|uniref:hypothetical protein n=1 Tax=Streptomyces sp. NPDC049906 TaxID=3155656 RepID=UPI003447374F